MNRILILVIVMFFVVNVSRGKNQAIDSFIVRYVDITEEMPISSNEYTFETNNPDFRTLIVYDTKILNYFIKRIRSAKQCKNYGTPDVKIKIISPTLEYPICIGYNLIQYGPYIVDRQDIFKMLK